MAMGNLWWLWQRCEGFGNTLTTIGLEFEYFVEEDLSIDLGFLFMDVDQQGGDANGFNFTLQLRWHLKVEEEWSFFIEGGAGLLRTSDNVPNGGSKFNFTPQAGFGMTFDVGENDARWLIGVEMASHFKCKYVRHKSRTAIVGKFGPVFLFRFNRLG